MNTMDNFVLGQLFTALIVYALTTDSVSISSEINLKHYVQFTAYHDRSDHTVA